MQADFWQDKYPESIPFEIDAGAYNSVLEVFHEAVHRYAERPAFSNMGQTLTYAELDQLSAQFAAYLQHHTDLVPGDRIAIQMPNLLQYPVVVFGALRAGLVLVNTNPLYTTREMLHQFTDSGCRAIIVLANFGHMLEVVLPQTDIRHIIVTEVGDLLPWPRRWLVNTAVTHIKKMVPSYDLPEAISFRAALKKGMERPAVDHTRTSSDLAVLQYTGGTTGPAKGTMLSHGNLVANLLQIRSVMTTFEPGREVMIAPLPLYHIFAFTVSCLGMIELGGHTVLITNPRDLPAFIKELSRWKYTTFVGLNTLFVGLMNNPDFRKLNFSSLKLTVAGGMAMQQQPAEEWEAMTGCRICEGYGLTETSPVVSINPLDDIRIGTIGMPVPNTLLKVMSEENTELGLNEPGELYVKGPQVMQGYWQHPEATAEAITADGWLRTGDIAVIQPDGFVRIVDRKKDMILVSGFNVYPNEIEEVATMHASVLECAAIGVPDVKSGEAIKLFVVKKDPFLTEENLIAHLRSNLTGYKVPRYIEFRADLPKSNVGKILRRELREV
ncbi:MAG: AMP-binding protein [Moraxellaceae bacterium]|nr:AMP-binding protein [Moraxellaceae bacterium]MDZ4387405.1 AMP-binding protein [Moraxellaceae bacterium]